MEWQVPDLELCQVVVAEKLTILGGRQSNKKEKITRDGKRSGVMESCMGSGFTNPTKV